MPSPRWWVFPVPFVWYHYYIKDYLCVTQLLDFVRQIGISALFDLWLLSGVFRLCPLNSAIHVFVTSNYVIASIKLYPDAGNGEFIILCNFGGRIMSGFESIEGNRSQEVKNSNMER